jgi:hypothetical protein
MERLYKILILSIALAGLCTNTKAQVINAPDLQCVNNDVSNSDVILNWTIPNNPCGAFSDYTIFQSVTPNGPFTQLAVITNQTQNTYTHTGALATSSTWYYYIVTNANCPGATQLHSDTVPNQSPVTPEIINVDVTTGGDVIFNWQPSTSGQTHYYVVYYYLPNGNAVPIDTIIGRFNTTFTDVTGDPSAQSLVYTVAAADSCWNISAFNINPHNTILAAATVEDCSADLTVSWNPKYINWPAGVLEYQILVSTNNGPFTEVASVDSSVSSYIYTGFIDGDSLEVVVRAISAADTNIVSNSNVVRLRALIVQTPSFNYITNITVLPDNTIQVSWILDSLAELVSYQVQQSANNVTYNSLGQQYITQAPPLPFNYTFIDSTGLPERNPYYYKTVLFDQCQTQYISEYGKSINLRGDLLDYYLAEIKWNQFELFGATVTAYRIYRDIGTGPQLINTVSATTTEYQDSLRQFVDYTEGQFCYTVEAVYDLSLPNVFGNTYQATLSSFSNIACIIHRPIIYIPNAFAPYGVNYIFKPTIIFGDPRNYLMVVYNRFGGKVFETTNPTVGWDGTDNGKEAQMGGYGYFIQFTAADGVQVERKGVVMLVK